MSQIDLVNWDGFNLFEQDPVGYTETLKVKYFSEDIDKKSEKKSSKKLSKQEKKSSNKRSKKRNFDVKHKSGDTDELEKDNIAKYKELHKKMKKKSN